MNDAMRFCWLVLFLCVIPIACTDNARSTRKNSIIGTWESVAGEAFGKEMDLKGAAEMRITFAQGKATWDFDMGKSRKAFDGFCNIDPDGQSGWIELGEPESKDPARVALGIYKVDGDTLKINMGKERPGDFDQPALTKLTFKRVK